MTVEVSAIFGRGLFSARPAAGNAGAHYFATDTGLMYRDNGSTWDAETPLDSSLSTSDVTTNNVTSAKHGFAPKSPGDASKFLNGAATPAWASLPAAAGAELDYKQITADVSVTGTADGTATTLITSNSVSYDGTAILIHVFTPRLQAPNAANGLTYVSVYEDSTLLGYVAIKRAGSASANNWAGQNGYLRRTPSAASHTYTVKGVVSSGTGVFGAGAGGTDYAPAFIRITKV